MKGSEDSTLLGEAPLEGDDNLPPVRGKHTSISMVRSRATVRGVGN